MALKRLLVLNVVGLSPRMLGENTPHIRGLAKQGYRASLQTVFPAVTCSVQASLLTGLQPEKHGIVANGWYFRDLAEVHFWKQSNRLIQGEKIWERLKRKHADFTSAQLFWWYNMFSTNDWTVTPRPAHLAGDRMISLVYTRPAELAPKLETALGRFPLFNFWGPMAGIESSQWIERCTLQVLAEHKPTLTLVYLPHLDYNLQRLGPDDPALAGDIRAVDAIVGRLAEAAQAAGAEVVVLSEYGMTEVNGAVDINRVLRENGFLQVQKQHTWELIDFGECRAFAVADHQVAHVYVRDAADLKPVKRLLEKTPGIDRVLDEDGRKELHIGHERAGELIAISAPDKWFTYYYWLDDQCAPPFARTVDIHQKPGYDPAELFRNPQKSKAGLITKVMMKKAGLSVQIDAIALNGSQVKGSHGRLTDSSLDGPVFISSTKSGLPPTSSVNATEVPDRLAAIIEGK
ncbi:MAG: alkaline phosphatase family protein [Planctomycetota bacterium]